MSDVTILTPDEAQERFPEAIARLLLDRAFMGPNLKLTDVLDEHDLFVDKDGELLFLNTFDELVDEWDEVDGCWMEFLDSDDDDSIFIVVQEKLVGD